VFCGLTQWWYFSRSSGITGFNVALISEVDLPGIKRWLRRHQRCTLSVLPIYLETLFWNIYSFRLPIFWPGFDHPAIICGSSKSHRAFPLRRRVSKYEISHSSAKYQLTVMSKAKVSLKTTDLQPISSAQTSKLPNRQAIFQEASFHCLY